MKTLKIFFVAALLLFFAFGNSYGQASNKNKETYYRYNVCMEHFYIGCPEIERMSGCYDVLIVRFENGKVLTKHDDIILIGDDTGKEYVARQIMNRNYTPENNATRVHTLHLYCEGKLIALVHLIIHWTIDAEGYWHLEVRNSFTKCFENKK